MPFVVVNIHQTKTNLSKLLQRVAAGEEITIAKAGVPVAKLVPIERQRAKRKLGLYRDQIWVADDFDAPLPDDILAGFLGEERETAHGKKPAASEIKNFSAKKQRKKK